MHTSRFQGRRRGLSSLISAATGIARDLEEDAGRRRLTDLNARLDKERFYVAVLGEFKRGKSTFLNVLLGERILPTGVLPVTSVVTEIEWAPTRSASVRFADGRVEEAPLSSIGDFVTERSNPRNRLGVERVHVRHPAPLLRDGVVLVDTPGVGSVFQHNTDVTLAFLPDVDAAIFLTAADPPISDGERAFLDRIREYAHKVLFVVNKIDLVSEGELEEVIAFTRAVIGESVGGDVEPFPVSALRAHDPGWTEGVQTFGRALETVLLDERGDLVLGAATDRLRTAVGGLRAGIQAELDALSLSELEVTSRIEELARIRQESERVREDLRALVAEEVRRLVAQVEVDLAEMRQVETQALLEEAERTAAACEAGEGEARSVELAVRERLVADLDRWRPVEEERVAAAFRDATARFVEQANAEAGRATRAAAEILDLQLAFVPRAAGIEATSRFSYSFFEVPTVLESLVPDISEHLPPRVAARRALKRIRAKIPMMVDKHSGRIRYDLVQRIEASARALTVALDDLLAATTESLEGALARAARHEGDDQRLVARRRMLSEAAERLNSLDLRAADLMQEEPWTSS